LIHPHVHVTELRSQPPWEVTQVLEHLFRHESGKMVAALARIFGSEHLQLAEDVVQEALARALRTWPFYGLPQNPAAWIMRASRNLALDRVRRDKVFREKEADVVRSMEQSTSASGVPGIAAEEIDDDRWRLMFVCCHPSIPAEAQVLLVLKTLCGLAPQRSPEPCSPRKSRLPASHSCKTDHPGGANAV